MCCKIFLNVIHTFLINLVLFDFVADSVWSILLSHALKNTANQRPGLPLYILRYATGSIPLFFPVITCAQQFTGVHLRTSQKPAPKLFNSCEPLRTFPITSGNFPEISEHFRRFPKFLKNHKNIWKTLLNCFRSFPKVQKSFKLLKNGFKAFTKF